MKYLAIDMDEDDESDPRRRLRNEAREVANELSQRVLDCRDRSYEAD